MKNEPEGESVTVRIQPIGGTPERPWIYALRNIKGGPYLKKSNYPDRLRAYAKDQGWKLRETVTEPSVPTGNETKVDSLLSPKEAALSAEVKELREALEKATIFMETVCRSLAQMRDESSPQRTFLEAHIEVNRAALNRQNTP